ncbi:MAG TPA: hypothetical protein VFS19_05225 [Planctomycetota bacterium]|nr:hypothetical protein [Planctomycetota bacterium]
MRLAPLGLLALCFLGCRSYELSESDARLLTDHVRRISDLRPDLDADERAMLEDWMAHFLQAAAYWHGKSVPHALDGCRTIEDYIVALKRVSGLDWRRMVTRTLLTFDYQASRKAKIDQGRRTIIETSPGFRFGALAQSKAHVHFDKIAAVAEQAWETATQVLGVRPEDLKRAPGIVVREATGGYALTEGRLPLFLAPSRSVFPEGARPTDEEGLTSAGIRVGALGKPDGGVNLELQCTIVYLNSYSLLAVAHEIVHAVTFLAFTRWEEVQAGDVSSEIEVNRRFGEALPVIMQDAFVIEGLAEAVSWRTPKLRKALLLDAVREEIKGRARAGGIPPLAGLRRDPYSPWTAMFFDYLIDTFGGEGIRRLLASRKPDLESAMRDAFGRELSNLEEGWRASLMN